MDAREQEGRMSQYNEIDLLDIIGHDKADHPDFCNSGSFWKWEQIVAIPSLISRGYTVVTNNYKMTFCTLEGDSCGPLTRGVVVEKDGVKSMAWYG